jgi:hypothetical protein
VQIHQINYDSHYEEYAQLQFVLITEVTSLRSPRLGTMGFSHLRDSPINTWYTNYFSELKWSNDEFISIGY